MIVDLRPVCALGDQSKVMTVKVNLDRVNKLELQMMGVNLTGCAAGTIIRPLFFVDMPGIVIAMNNH